ncbi:MAG: hypothetical protein H6742_14870 [Alphaproteobacteria bacterium]|nr:hypothetical protein [Alphaproteobacteria bacterium]
MWQAVAHNKVEVVLGQHSSDAPAAWRAVVDRSEDLLTALVFERLAYLPGVAGTELILRAARPTQLDFIPTPSPILDSVPWPNLADGGPKVEPDWVIETADYTIVVEAKWGRGNVPSEAQIEAQSAVAREAYPRRKLVHLAVVQTGEVRFPPGVQGLTVRWGSLRQEILRLLGGDLDQPRRRILGDIRDALDRRGLDSTFLASLPALRLRGEFVPWGVAAQGPRPLPALPDVVLDLDAMVTPWI